MLDKHPDKWYNTNVFKRIHWYIQLVGATSMLNILTQLLNGQVKTFEEIGKNSDEIKELEKFIEQNFKELNNELNTKQKEILEKYSECVEEYFNLLIEDSFCTGFSLSTRILTESLIKSEKLYMK